MLKINLEIFLQFEIFSSNQVLSWIIENSKEEFNFERKFVWDLISSILERNDEISNENLNFLSKKRELKF
jgi:hypothetical protein